MTGKRQTIIFYLFLISILSSCENVININLKNSEPRIVIEGSVSNLSDTATVLLHRTTDYYQPSTIQPVKDATVTISDSTGKIFHLTETRDGVYKAANFFSQPGASYTLNVNTSGSAYTASSRMPMLVRIDRIYLDSEPDRPGEDRVNIQLNDPKGIENFYQLEIFRNDSLLTTGERIMIYSDKFFDGTSNVIMLSGRRLGIGHFNHGDLIKVRLKNIDQAMYNYYDVLNSITNGMGILSASSPSNPPANISGDALGYFAAWSVSEKTMKKM